MVKDCPIHGHFEDVMSIDTAFFKHLEEVFPGRDIRAHNDEKLHNHGTSTVTHGRGSVLTIDLTNRCNMMCDPCFMDANQVGFVHELTWDEIKTMLDNAVTIKPRRQMSRPVLRRRAHALALLPRRRRLRPQGRLHSACRPRPTASSSPSPRSSADAAAEAGLRYAYLQFDGIGNAANSHRKVGNLFDVKLQAIDNLHEAGVDIVPVTTIVNGINNEQVGRIIQFALDNPKKINFLSFQPVCFTGRDEAVSDERRAGPALHALATWRTTSRTRPAWASPPATGSPSPSCPPSPTGPTWSTDPTATGASSPAAAIPTAASAWR